MLLLMSVTRSTTHQPRETKFKFSILSIGVSVRLTNYSHWDSWFMGVKHSQMFIQTKTSPRLETRWGYLPISMVLRSERSLKSKMLSLARTSKYVNDTSVLSIKKSEDDS